MMEVSLENVIKKCSGYELKYMDEFVDDCLRLSTYLDVDLPPLTKRVVLEETNMLKPKASLLEDEEEDFLPEPPKD